MDSFHALRQKTLVGIIWTFFEQLFRSGIQSITTLILAWFLLPEDFGLMAMITVFFSIASSLTDSGFGQALIRKIDVNQIDYSTAFYTNLVLGFVVYALLCISAPTIASFYNESRLVLLVRIVGLVVIINSFHLVQVADLTQKINFGIQFKVTLPSAIFSGIVAILMAAMGFGIWSLVAQMLVSSFMTTFLYWIVNKWRPIKEFSFRSLKEMFNFGSKLMASSILDVTFQNIYTVVIGKLFSATSAGYYFFSLQIQQTIVSLLTNTVQKVTYPALSTIQDNNTALKEFYRKIIQAVSYIIFPLLIILMVLAKSLFSLFLKDSWLPAVPYLRLLCVVGLLYPLHAINLNILKVKGRSDLFLYLELVKKLMITIVIAISIHFGIYGILIGQIVTSILAYVPNSYYSTKLINYSIKEQLNDFVPTLLLASAMGCFMYAFGLILSFGEVTYILVIGFAGIAFYAILNYLFKLPAQIFLLNIVKEQYLKKEVKS